MWKIKFILEKTADFETYFVINVSAFSSRDAISQAKDRVKKLAFNLAADKEIIDIEAPPL